MQIAFRTWIHGMHGFYYVAQIPGDGGKDWGYTTEVEKALPLSPYWQRRFRRDCEHVGYEARFMDA